MSCSVAMSRHTACSKCSRKCIRGEALRHYVGFEGQGHCFLVPTVSDDVSPAPVQGLHACMQFGVYGRRSAAQCPRARGARGLLWYRDVPAGSPSSGDVSARSSRMPLHRPFFVLIAPLPHRPPVWSAHHRGFPRTLTSGSWFWTMSPIPVRNKPTLPRARHRDRGTAFAAVSCVHPPKSTTCSAGHRDRWSTAASVSCEQSAKSTLCRAGHRDRSSAAASVSCLQNRKRATCSAGHRDR